MTTTFDPHIAGNGTVPASEATVRFEAAPSAPARTGRRWPLFGAVGAVTAFAAVLLSIPALEEEDYSAGPEVIEKLTAGPYRVAFLLGLVTVGLLFAAATGWKRWAAHRAPDDIAARLVGQGLVATATVNIIFYGIAGAMGLYLEGGVEAETGLGDQGLFVYHTMLDFGSLLGWWGAALSAIAVAVVALRKDRLLPRWMGITSVLLLLPPVALAIGTSLPGFIGLTMPIWLLVTSIGMTVSKVARADA